jgi:predicted enzyme related to lactoylglutathione lyase
MPLRTLIRQPETKEEAMGKRTRYEPGTFCWIDFQTIDPESTKAFYSKLFGWQAVDMPVGNGTTYTMLTLDGDDVAALNEMDAEQREASIPPHWFSYISVADADETAAKARELGGTVFGEAFDVLDAGRMAIIQDPLGATFAAWQPKNHIGAGRVNDTGCLAWNELQTRDHEAATTGKRPPSKKTETPSISPSKTKAP